MSSVTVDSANTSQIQYQTDGPYTWLFITTNGNSKIYGSTLSEVYGPCNAMFSFYGTQVWVMGTVMPSTSDSTPPVSLYSIDGGNFVSYQAPSMEIEADGMTFFASEDLSQGHHTLYIEVNQASEVAPYMLDSISYTPISEPQSSFSSSLSSSTSSVASPSQPSPSSSLNGTGRHSTSPDSSNATGAIVGGVVGGLLTLAGALLVLYYCSRRRPESYKYKAMRRDSRGSFLPSKAPSLRDIIW
ncbi:hypothetical protein AcW1_002587 [Taiwanofungus camphoratus]|nr:hypothetical protein AcV7_002112 [Antrodia cinnamomea]KAI0943422.1 hypothetical protein AcW1_002587 [Antrodia cinnamomea]